MKKHFVISCALFLGVLSFAAKDDDKPIVDMADLKPLEVAHMEAAILTCKRYLVDNLPYPESYSEIQWIFWPRRDVKGNVLIGIIHRFRAKDKKGEMDERMYMFSTNAEGKGDVFALNVHTDIGQIAFKNAMKEWDVIDSELIRTLELEKKLGKEVIK